jgi:hypothetical protein
VVVQLSEFINKKGADMAAAGSVAFHGRLYAVVRLALAGVFLWAGAIKLADPAAFAGIIRGYALAPEFLVPWLALGLPALEVLAALGLAANVRGSLAAVAGMLLLFLFVLWYGILADLHIDCGCFGPEDLAEQDGLRAAFYRDWLLLAAAGYLHLARRRNPALAPRTPRSLFTRPFNKEIRS